MVYLVGEEKSNTRTTVSVATINLEIHQNYMGDLALLPEKQKHISRAGQSRSVQKWTPPVTGWVKNHVDAALLRNGDRGAIAAVCRDHTGMFLGASAVTVDMTNPEILEAEACSEGLSLALDLNVQKVQIVTDCLATVKHVTELYMGSSKVVVEEIKTKLRMFTSSGLEAHALAKAATSLARGRHLWLTGTPDIICIPLTVEV